MGKNTKSSEVNKSAAIRELYKQDPQIKAQEVMATLAGQGIKVSKNLIYLVKGKAQGEQSHRRKVHKSAMNAAKASGSTDAVKTIIKVKALAREVGGLAALKELVDALGS